MKVLGDEEFIPLLIPNYNRNIILCPVCFSIRDVLGPVIIWQQAMNVLLLVLGGVLVVSPHENNVKVTD